MSEASSRRFFSIAEFAQLSGLSDSTIRRRIRDLSLPSVQVGGSGTKLLIPADALNRPLVAHSGDDADVQDDENSTSSTVSSDAVAPATNDVVDRGATSVGRSGPRPSWRSQSHNS